MEMVLIICDSRGSGREGRGLRGKRGVFWEDRNSAGNCLKEGRVRGKSLVYGYLMRVCSWA